MAEDNDKPKGSEEKKGREGGRRRGGRGSRAREEKEKVAAPVEAITTDVPPPPEENGTFDPDARDAGPKVRRADGGEGTLEAEDEKRARRGRERRGRERRGRGRERGNREVEELGASSGIDIVETGRRREGGSPLDPGLTLKELLPFLRPPKTVLVLGASSGGGHNRTAAALYDGLKGLDRNLLVRQHDCLELTEPSFPATEVRTRLEALARDPHLYGAPFETFEGGPDAIDAAGIDEMLGAMFREKMDHVVVDKRPDWVVCTHWLPFKHLEALKAAGRLDAEVLAVVPEPEVHARWVSPIVSHWIVADDQVRNALVRREVDAAEITVTGVPVGGVFAGPVDRGAVAREIGIDKSRTTVLIRPGGVGAAERTAEVLKTVAASGQALNLLVVTGKNERLREELEKLELPEDVTIKAFGFVQNIHELMAVADLLVTRASPHTVAEAQAMGLPMLLLRPSPGIEDRIADRLLRLGVAWKVYGEDDLVGALTELSQHRRLMKDLKDAAERARRPDAVQAAVQRIAKVVK